MVEKTKEFKSTIRQPTRWLGISAAALAFMATGPESTSAQTRSSHKRPTPLVAAEQAIKKEITNRKPVHFDATNDLYWPAQKFTERTSVPLVASVRGVLRYFELDQEGDSLKTIDVKALPVIVGPVQSKWDSLYHDGQRPNETGLVKLGKHSLPYTKLAYPDGTHFQVIAGRTESHIGPILLPPLICRYTPGEPAKCTS